MTFKSYFDHTQPISNDLLNDFFMTCTCLFMFRYSNLQNLPEIFDKYFLTNEEIHYYNTRNASLLHKSCTRTNYKKHTLANNSIKLDLS